MLSSSLSSAFLIHLFAVGYMHGDKGFYRFFAYLNLFMFAMLTLVLADNFLLMFVGWEGVGLCSYLLIGYYIDRKEAGDAAKKAFITNRVGDWGFVLGIMLIFTVTGSISFFDKPAMELTSALSRIRRDARRSVYAGEQSSPAAQLRWRCCFSSAPPERARRFRCTSGCRTRWPVLRPCPR